MKKSFETILVGSDLSARSDRALQRAVQLAKAHGARIVVASIIDDAMPHDIQTEVESRTASTLKRQVDFVAKDVAHEIIIRTGHASTDMITIINDLKPDLLVMGTHRDKGFLGAFRETTAQRIVRMTSCSTLIVSDAVDHDYDVIVACTDFSPASRTSLQVGHSLNPKARIIPVHALQIPYAGLLASTPDATVALEASFRNEAARGEAAWRAELGVETEPTVFETAPVFSVIASVTRAEGATLITVGAHGRVGASPALLGSLASDLLRDPPTDVLVARP